MFFDREQPVRVVFLRDSDIDNVTKWVFSERCLLGDSSVKELAEKKKMSVETVDMGQKPCKMRADTQLGSCDRESLLVQMLGGGIKADGTGEKLNINSLEYDPDFECVIEADLGEHVIDVRHKGLIKLNGNDRWIILQDNGNLPRERVESLLNTETYASLRQ